jgi:hypothetical protein
MLLGIVALLAGCAPTAPGSLTDPNSPAFKEAAHIYEMGCLPGDKEGLERNAPYCGHNGGNKR